MCERVGLDGTVLPARLPATAAAFENGQIGLRHVELIARVLGTDTAGRLTSEVWAEVETILAARATESTPAQVLSAGTAMVDALDADGAEPGGAAVAAQVQFSSLICSGGRSSEGGSPADSTTRRYSTRSPP